jgi:CheY-like chemotaxis protein
MQACHAGADDFLPKPIRKAQLESKIAAIRALRVEDPGKAPSDRRVRQRLLLLESARDFQRLLGNVLEHAGYQLMYASDGDEALRRIEGAQDQLDAFVVDEKSAGLSWVRALSENPLLKGKPIVILGELDAPERLEEYRQLTGSAMIDKRKQPVEAILSGINARLHRLSLDMRASQRVPYYAVTEFRKTGASDWLCGFSYDLSAGGLFVRTLTPLPHGADVEMRIIESNRGTPFVCTGLVAWANRVQTAPTFSYPVGMGIKFAALSAAQVTAVGALIRSAAARTG